MDEAQRCLHCKHKPCVAGCPVQIHIPDFIAKVAEGDFEAAYQIISASQLPAGRLRPGVSPGDASARVNACGALRASAVGIGRLERFVADWHNRPLQSAARRTGTQRRTR